MQLAITKDEKLVYQAQYGYADLNNTEVVTDDSVYRLASVSKTITAVTILRMVQDGCSILMILFLVPMVFWKLILEPLRTKQTLKISWLGTFWIIPLVLPIIQMIHFFVNNEWTLQQLIDDVLDNRELATVPGETYFYSNFGYCILGRIVEKISGMTYENYVKQSIFEPLGISEMNIARSAIEEKLPNEVEYLGQESFGAYQFNAERIDALGGWTASATDLAKLMVGIDRQNGVADIINTEVMADMYFEFPEWTFWGSLPGTSAVIYRLGDEFNFTIISNTRVLPNSTLNRAMMDTMREHGIGNNFLARI